MIASFASTALFIKVARLTNADPTRNSISNDSITYVEPEPNARLTGFKSVALTTEFSRGVE